MTVTTESDATMAAITNAVARGREGDPDTARRELNEIWQTLRPQGDPLHRCALAHYLADLYDDAAQALAWDIRALDAADSLTDERAKRYHESLSVRGFYPSLHLNLADNYRRLGSFDAAAEQLAAARTGLDELPDDEYGNVIRTAVVEVEQAILARDTEPRASAPTGRPS
ncbi:MULTISPECIES: hypothetical protein [unclassified Nocardia]|uniref:hypothetical protein n=1 Tax=unclassified Nocardia TaxID=2637762 RepID=UPI001CE42959|nr:MULTISPECIES: hypothetical protein [unclassified Nocardia]